MADTPLTQKSAWKGKSAAPPAGVLHTRSTHLKSLPGNLLGEITLRCNWYSANPETLSAFGMSGFLPLDCARVKLAQALIKLVDT